MAAMASPGGCSLEQGALDEHARHHVRVQVRGGAAVLVVAARVVGHHAPHADGAPAVGHAPREVVDRGRLVLARQAALVALPVRRDVLRVALPQLLHLLLDVLVPHALLARVLVRVVDVAAGPVPVAGDGLGVERNDDVVEFADAVQDVTRHPVVVAALHALARAHLVLPLAGHDLAVDPRDLDARVQAHLEVRLGHVAADRRARAGRAVVGALGAGIAVLRPPEGPEGVRGEEGVLLLDPKPRPLLLGLLHDGGGRGTRVARVCHNLREHLAVLVHLGRDVAVAHHEEVVPAAEGVPEHGTRHHVHLRVIAGGLAGRRAVEVPHGELTD